MNSYEKKRVQNLKYKRENKDKLREYNIKYRQENKEEINRRNRINREENRAYIKEFEPEKYRELRDKANEKLRNKRRDKFLEKVKNGEYFYCEKCDYRTKVKENFESYHHGGKCCRLEGQSRFIVSI